MVQITCNIGGYERTTRIGLGATLLGMSLAAPIARPARIAAGAVGAICLVTGLIQYCPISQAFGINTCPGAHRPH